MIASLTGIVAEVSLGSIVLDVGGVGYLVAVTPATATALRLGERTTLATSMIVREDSMSLFGFGSKQEREIFDVLRSVSGIGPKMALAVLAQLEPAAIAAAVASENDKAFSAISGIGPKTAKLLVVTLAGRLASIGVMPAAPAPEPSAAREPVVLALVGLGIGQREAEALVDETLATNPGASRDVLLRDALARLGSAKAGVKS